MFHTVKLIYYFTAKNNKNKNTLDAMDDVGFGIKALILEFKVALTCKTLHLDLCFANI